MSAKALAVFGSASDVGKSVVVTALCRIFSDMGIKTAPFKAQNMSNNSFVTYDNKEIGRAQAVQAFACGIIPTADMNPVLLKPSSDRAAQVIIQGKPAGSMEAMEYFNNTDFAFERALESLNRLKDEYELIIIEGAGSCAEVNLRGSDFVNFKTAQAADANVILVADIDKGGVFAQIIGTLECLTKEERELVKGFVVNKFRGDKMLFNNGVDFIEERTGLPVLGIIPYFRNIEIEHEDSLPEEFLKSGISIEKNKINIAVLRLPHISNFTDFMPFNLEKQIRLHFLFKPGTLEGYDALLIPGSKGVIDDMQWIRRSGWDIFIKDYVRKGGYVFGICGGYQIMGKTIEDPYSVESDTKIEQGLSLFNGISVMGKDKHLTDTKGVWLDGNVEIEGYEIHMGETILKNEKPAIRVTSRNDKFKNDFDGVIKGRVSGCYLHGIFDNHTFRHYFLKKIAEDRLKNLNCEDYKNFRDSQYRLLAEHFMDNLNIEKLMNIAGV